MPVSIRPLFLATLVSSVAVAALAQTPPAPERRSLAPGSSAAATLPNTFDGPAAPAPVLPATPPAPVAQVTEVDIAEGALRAVIADLGLGQLDEALFTEDLAGRLRPQLATLRPVVQGFGALGAVTPQGVSNGANQFEVAFDNAVTQWVIGLDEDGRIAALLFRPAPPVSSEPPATETDASETDPAPATATAPPPPRR